MSQHQDNQERSRKLLSKTFLLRIVAVLLFVALGSFAVFQSVLGDKTKANLQAMASKLTGNGTTATAGGEIPKGTPQITASPEKSGTALPAPAPVVQSLSPVTTQLARFTAGDGTETPSQPKQEPTEKPLANPASEDRFSAGKSGFPDPTVPVIVSQVNSNPSGPESVAITKLPDLTRPIDNPNQIPSQQVSSRTMPDPMVPAARSFTDEPKEPAKQPAAFPPNNVSASVGANIQQQTDAAKNALRGTSDNLLEQANSIVGKFDPPKPATQNPAETKQSEFNPFPPNSPFAKPDQETPAANPPEEPRTPPQQNLAPIRAIPGSQPGQFDPKPAATGQTSQPIQPNSFPANQFPGQPSPQTNPAPGAETNPAAQPNRQPFGSGRTELPGASANNTPVIPAASTPLIPAGIRNNYGSGSPIPGAIPAGTLATPGETSLEGVQTPALAIEKIAPREIQVNQPAKFRIVVRNVGRVPASDVRVYDKIPAGTELISSNPQPDNKPGGDGLSWSLGDMPAGQEKSIEIELRPTRPGEIGSVAQVTFASQASMRTRVTRPELSIEHTAPAQVMIGSPVTLQITARNNGDGPATNVIIQEKVPEQLRYNAGVRDLEYEIGTLAPGQSRSIALTLESAAIGQFRNIVGIVGDGGLNASHETTIEVISPEIVTSTDGPHRRFLKRDTSHTLSVKNSGTATATNLDLIAQLPRSLRFVGANNQGQYDPGSHAVYWSLAELRPGLSASVELQSEPVETGNSQIEFTARADLNQKSTIKHDVAIEHLVDVYFEIDDVTDHIETGTTTEYRIRIINQGTKPASNVRLLAEFDNGIRPDSVSGGLRGQAQGQQIAFEPIPNINPGEEITASILATGTAPGEHRVAVNLQTDGREINITKEESTRVYADR